MDRMIAPTSHQRIQTIAKDAGGFIYCVSGVTGIQSTITTDKTEASINYRYYKEASSCKEAKLTQNQNSTCISIPKDAQKGDTIHIIVQAKANGHYGLVKYQQVIITIE